MGTCHISSHCHIITDIHHPFHHIAGNNSCSCSCQCQVPMSMTPATTAATAAANANEDDVATMAAAPNATEDNAAGCSSTTAIPTPLPHHLKTRHTQPTGLGFRRVT